MTRLISGLGLGPYVKSLPAPVGLEIGCANGDTSKYLLDCNPNLKMYSIDPYENYVDWNGNNLVNMGIIYKEAMELLSPYGERFVHIKDYSDNVIDMFEDSSLDFIFIDGLHTYEQVSKDCKNYYSKVKPGGVFSGHDYSAIIGVNKAVNEFAAGLKKAVTPLPNDAWMWCK